MTDISKLNKLDDDQFYMTDSYAFFYGSWASNFYASTFKWAFNGEEHEFFCTEQAFMWAKAMMFEDKAMANAILKEKNNPLECKHCGRYVRNYDDDVWSSVRYDIMVEVNIAKFTQNEELKAKLLDEKFDNKVFVEASPTDCIWGIGRSVGDPKIVNDTYWRGQNLLGKALTKVRNEILSDQQDGV